MACYLHQEQYVDFPESGFTVSTQASILYN